METKRLEALKLATRIRQADETPGGQIETYDAHRLAVIVLDLLGPLARSRCEVAQDLTDEENARNASTPVPDPTCWKCGFPTRLHIAPFRGVEES